MVHLSRYWEILRLDPSGQGRGYRCQFLTSASEFFQEQFPDMDAIADFPLTPSPHPTIQVILFSLFRTEAVELAAKAGLCLRCYVSYPILNTCKKIARQFSASGRFTYQELLAFVLNDDGRSPIILGQDGKQQMLNQAELMPMHYPLFTVEVLRKFDPNASSSLDTWAYYQTRQNQELKNFLAEQGLSYLSDWALLNRAKTAQLELLSPDERQLVEAFHAVYRRDRRQRLSAIASPCADPTPTQLQEILHILQKKDLQKKDSPIQSAQPLMEVLKQIATHLRQYEVWNRSGPGAALIESTNSETEVQRELPDPNTTNTLENIEQETIREFCHQQLVACLDQGIYQTLQDQINQLKQRPRFSVFASRYLPALQLIYGQGLSQTEVAQRLEMTNQTQVNRVVNLKNLLSQVRLQTVEQLSQKLIDIAQHFSLASVSSKPDDLKNLVSLIEDFADAEVFQAAASEIMNAKSRTLNSVYAQRLRHHIQASQERKP